MASATDKLNIILEATDRASGTFRGLQGSITEFNQGLEIAAKLVRGFEAALRPAGLALERGITLAIDYEKNAFKLSQALSNQGVTSRAATEDLLKFGDALQRATQFSDDQIIPAMVQLTNISGKTGEELKQLTQLTLDAAVTFNRDLSDAAVLVGKSAVGVTDRLNELGLSVDANVVGKAERGKAALEVLAAATNNMALAVGVTLSGSLGKLSSVFDTFLRSIGEGVSESKTFKTAVDELTNTFGNLSDSVSENDVKLKSLVNNLVLALADLSVILAEGLIRLDALLARVPTIQDMVKGFGNLKDAVSRAADEFTILESEFLTIATTQKQFDESTSTNTIKLNSLSEMLKRVSPIWIEFADDAEEAGERVQKVFRDFDFDISSGGTEAATGPLGVLLESLKRLRDEVEKTANKERELANLEAQLENLKNLEISPEGFLGGFFGGQGLEQQIAFLEERIMSLQKDLGLLQDPLEDTGDAAEGAGEKVKKFADDFTGVFSATELAEAGVVAFSQIEDGARILQDRLLTISEQEKEARELAAEELLLQQGFLLQNAEILDETTGKWISVAEATQQAKERTEAVKEEAERLKEQMEFNRQVAAIFATNIAQLGGSLVSAALQARKSFSEFFKDFSIRIADAITQALILRSIMGGFGFLGFSRGGKVPTAGLVPTASGTLAAQGGGLITGGVSGRDSVPALLTPGEVVINAPVVRQIEQALLQRVENERVEFSINNNFNNLITREVVEEFTREQNKLAEFFGLEVVSTRTVL